MLKKLETPSHCQTPACGLVTAGEQPGMSAVDTDTLSPFGALNKIGILTHFDYCHSLSLEHMCYIQVNLRETRRLRQEVCRRCAAPTLGAESLVCCMLL